MPVRQRALQLERIRRGQRQPQAQGKLQAQTRGVRYRMRTIPRHGEPLDQALRVALMLYRGERDRRLALGREHLGLARQLSGSNSSSRSP